MPKWTWWCVLLLASLSRVAFACSCRPGLSLERHYQRADHVLVGKISGCAPDRLSQDGYCRDHAWTFDTLENLKGSDARVRGLPADAGKIADTCYVAPKVGEVYLLFLQDGRTDQCSGTGPLGGETDVRKQSDLEILRAFRDGKITSIVNPWYFSDAGWACGIEHLLDGGGYLHFSYAYGTPPVRVPRSQDESSKSLPAMTLRVLEPFDVIGPARLEIDGESIALTRRTVQLSNTRNFSLDIVEGPTALALLDRLIQPAELVFSGNRSTLGGRPEPFRATTSAAFAAQAAARFKACVAAHPASN